ncbi:skin secretory protein xP2-like isoform X2 [Colias croceus]|nr:skin secretory protein xP2-like isoform X2 [Colias croceus]XP_045504172.1 skin secretory protein xP2-like isoform X2 [Colias croceus]XP_045504173.1 skin secretory protein xP2-like isoform X2 [Colias croceus]
MTSTSFNVGLGDGSRLSSRVLRPPGGGHTDIFGGEPEPPRGRRQVPAASGAMFGHGDEPVKTPTAAETPTQNGSNGAPEPAPQPEPAQAAPAQVAPAQVEPAQVAPAQVEPEQAKPAPVQAAPKESPKTPEQPKTEAPKRVRVPPGGFSSGLW